MDAEEPNWQKYVPSQLKRPKAAKLKVGGSKSPKKSWSKLASVKAEWTKLKIEKQIQIMEEEHQLKMQQMREKFNFINYFKIYLSPQQKIHTILFLLFFYAISC